MDIYLDSTIELIKIKYLVLGILIGFAFGFAAFRWPSLVKSHFKKRPK